MGGRGSDSCSDWIGRDGRRRRWRQAEREEYRVESSLGSRKVRTHGIGRFGNGRNVRPQPGQGMWPGPQVKEGWFEEGNVYGEGAESKGRRRAQGGAEQRLGDHRTAPAGHGLSTLMFTDVFPSASKLDLEQGKSR